jgi:5-methylcytosine-specific restriction enzyme subunit McrC
LKNSLQVFEYSRIKTADISTFLKTQYPGREETYYKSFAQNILSCFFKYYDLNIDKVKNSGPQIFTLIKDGIQFNNYVGIIRIGVLTIEVLPKIDTTSNYSSDFDNTSWQNLLYKMIRSINNISGKSTGYANVKVHSNHLIDLYINQFVDELSAISRSGYIKKYHSKQTNNKSLKGRIIFQKQITQNLIHAERFFVDYKIYDKDNLLNQILFKALIACRQLNSSAYLKSKIEAEILKFPDVADINITELTFSKIVLDKKNQGYKTALELARFILLNLFPGMKKGENNAIALMYDMNKLYEKYLEKKLRRALGPDYRVTGQETSNFWRLDSKKNYRKTKPDLTVYKKDEIVAVLDTKWKIPKGDQFPIINDLRQMFVYNQYFSVIKKRTALVYPAKIAEIQKGKFYDDNKFGCCDLVFISIVGKGSLVDIKIDNLIDYILSIED